ncbi:NotI family restriction endonuclease [Trichothermofontia sichuanensis B231]|uniref:NotI family restriction endonuclease n=1 Tax=Trichothermofontia sichuanensis TaxID=3045816 RepID=UPI0022484F73|nr:NotI family restriction endonuclease [Trichothermofontia sichuanensis]UZQ53533.1 NotI family restriction endonuclease [Trichothermofontia sichuanensis B231]
MSNNPLAEVFGFPSNSFSEQAERYRRNKLCPYNNKVPNCTKDKANDPLGVCSIYHRNSPVITCAVRFRQNWLIAENAATFFFGSQVNWTSLTEVRLKDANGQSAGNIDVVPVSYDDRGRVLDFGAVEIQAVYISGNVRRPFETYMSNPQDWENIDWSKLADYYPTPDYLSSSRKRLIPQLLYKGAILNGWNKKQVVVVQKSFFETLPNLPRSEQEQAEIAWHLYDLQRQNDQFDLILRNVFYTEYWSAINRISTPEPGRLEDFMAILQQKLDDKLENPPDTQTILDIPLQ